MTRSSVERQLDRSEQIRVTPETADWNYLAYSLHVLEPGQSVGDELADRETAIVVLEGQAELRLGDATHAVARSSVFTELAPVGYVPPRVGYEVTARTDLVVAIGSAPAEGRYPARLIEPSRIRSEVRGGGAALRQVNHTLAPPLEAERLILYEVYVPRGSWSGWPPHRHDGEEGSPYLEEVYYFRLDRPEGFWMHRNFAGPDVDSLRRRHARFRFSTARRGQQGRDFERPFGRMPHRAGRFAWTAGDVSRRTHGRHA
jgi:5-deoxy-glucuronate isomerase